MKIKTILKTVASLQIVLGVILLPMLMFSVDTIASSVTAKTMDMNPFKPLFQHFEEFYGKILSIKEPLNNFYLKLRLSKANANA